MFYLFHLKSKFSASLSRSHYQSIKNLKTEVQIAKSCHGYIYTVKIAIKISEKLSIVYLCRHLLVQSEH